jgi:NAD+ synthase
MKDMEKTANSIAEWIKSKVEEACCKGVVFGISGGIDSAVIAALCKKVYPDTSLGVIMPCNSNPEDESDARLVAGELELELEKVDLTETYETLIRSIGGDFAKQAASNIKPRLRMTTLYYYAQKKNYLVVGSSNKSELTVGYFTKHGDSGVDILPIADLVKRDVFELAKHLGINQKIIDKSPSAGLWEGQTDEDEMGFSYENLDRYIESGKLEDAEAKAKIERMNRASEHKRKFPPSFIAEK